MHGRCTRRGLRSGETPLQHARTRRNEKAPSELDEAFRERGWSFAEISAQAALCASMTLADFAFAGTLPSIAI